MHHRYKWEEKKQRYNCQGRGVRLGSRRWSGLFPRVEEELGRVRFGDSEENAR